MRANFTSKINEFIEHYLYSPNFAHKILACALWPLSLIWSLVASIRAHSDKKFHANIPVFSVGNISAGGNNKSPFVRALAQFLASAECAQMAQQPQFAPHEIAIILRGYGRASKGLLRVEKIDAKRYGDEACEHKMLLPQALIFVCEDRVQGIKAAIAAGAKVAILDDAFAKFHIEKFDFLLENPAAKYLPFCLPAGPLRLSARYKSRANFTASAGSEYEISCTPPERLGECFFLSAIAKPQRLENIYSCCAGRLLLADHARFCEEQIERQMRECGALRLICTGKDAVKLSRLKPEIIVLKITLKSAAKAAVAGYLQEQAKLQANLNQSK